MFVEVQALRENKTIGLRRNHLNFAFPDISSSIYGKIRQFYAVERVLKFKSRIQSLHDDRLFQFHLNSFQRAWNRGSEKAGHGWARAHDLRHFFCSFLLNNDVDHMTVATLSGHKSLKVLKDRYGHFDDQTLERAMSVFDRIVGLDSRKSPAVQK